MVPGLLGWDMIEAGSGDNSIFVNTVAQGDRTGESSLPEITVASSATAMGKAVAAGLTQSPPAEALTRGSASSPYLFSSDFLGMWPQGLLLGGVIVLFSSSSGSSLRHSQ